MKSVIFTDKNVVILELKQFFRRFMNDAIATNAFGVEVNSLKNPENEFYKMGEKITKLTFVGQLRFILFIMVPSLMKVRKSNRNT